MRGGFEWARGRKLAKGHGSDPELAGGRTSGVAPVTPRARFLAARQQRINAVRLNVMHGCALPAQPPVEPSACAHTPRARSSKARGLHGDAWRGTDAVVACGAANSATRSRRSC